MHDYQSEGNDDRGTWGYCARCGIPMFKPDGFPPDLDSEVVRRPEDVPDCER